MSAHAFQSLEAVIRDPLFAQLDLDLRRGRHVGAEDGAAFQLLVDGEVHLEAFYEAYGCDLVRGPERFYYLLPRGDKLGRAHLSRGDMLIGQVLAALALDPSTITRGGVISRTDLLTRLDMLVETADLVRALKSGRRSADERGAEEFVRARVGTVLRNLEALGFVDLRDGDLVRLRSALFRFVDPVRVRGELSASLERLERAGEVIVGTGADLPDEEEP